MCSKPLKFRSIPGLAPIPRTQRQPCRTEGRDLPAPSRCCTTNAPLASTFRPLSTSGSSSTKRVVIDIIPVSRSSKSTLRPRGIVTVKASDRRAFSISTHRMAGTKIDGTAIAKGIREKLNAQIKETQQSNPRYKPSLKIVQGMSTWAPKVT